MAEEAVNSCPRVCLFCYDAFTLQFLRVGTRLRCYFTLFIINRSDVETLHSLHRLSIFRGLPYGLGSSTNSCLREHIIPRNGWALLLHTCYVTLEAPTAGGYEDYHVPSAGIWRHVVRWNQTDLLEQHGVSIIRAKGQVKQDSPGEGVSARSLSCDLP
jgi:hypothetical protein